MQISSLMRSRVDIYRVVPSDVCKCFFSGYETIIKKQERQEDGKGLMVLEIG